MVRFKRYIQIGLDTFLGKQEFGLHRWLEMSRSEQEMKVHEVVSNDFEGVSELFSFSPFCTSQNSEQLCEARVKSCKFDAFLAELQKLVGEPNAQKDIIRQRVEKALSQLVSSDPIYSKLCEFYTMTCAVGIRKDINWNAAFWRVWKEKKQSALRKLGEAPKNFKEL